MPSLVAFHRKWNIASDDFVFSSLTEAIGRLTWIAFGVIVFVLHYPAKCKEDVSLYLSVLLILNLVTVVLCFITAWISSRGTILDPRPRRHVTTCIYVRLPFFVLEIIWTIIATVLIFEGSSLCNFLTAVRVTVVLEWILIVSVFIAVIVVFNSVEDVGDDAHLNARRLWTRRMRLLKCGQDEQMITALDEIANLMAAFFAHNDVVLSDIVSGLLLVVHSPLNISTPLQTAESPSPDLSWMNMKRATHFLDFAIAVYGWPTYLVSTKNCVPCWRLTRKIRCCGQLRCNQVLIVKDNCCLCNTTSFSLQMEDRNVDLFYVSFHNTLYKVPFVVLTDHDTQSIVITIRGSLSLMDAVTDLCLNDEVFTVDVDSDPLLRQDQSLDEHGEVRVHKGMLISARYIYDELRNNHVLDDLFVLNPNYNLVVCGHSLGAGVASLLTLLLKQSYPRMQCFAYSPPGCVISEAGRQEMEAHVMGIIAGDDIVPRISFHSLYKLRESIDCELRACSKAKYEILIKGVFRLFFHAPWELSGRARSRDRVGLIRETSSSLSYGTQTPPASPTVGCPERVELYAPGKLFALYIDEEEELHTEWIDARCLSDVKLSASAFTDHLPHNVKRILERAIEEEEMSSVMVV